MKITPDQWKKYSATFDLEVPATAAQIKAAEAALGKSFPAEYVEFLGKTNGAEGPIGEKSYLMLWKVDVLKELNDAYHVQEHAPGFLIFGSTGGGEAFAFDLDTTGNPICMLPFIGMCRDLAEVVAADFWSFLDGQYCALE